MITVFALMIYTGQQLQPPTTHWYDINRCKDFAQKIMNQPPLPKMKQAKTVAICKMVNVKEGTLIYE